MSNTSIQTSATPAAPPVAVVTVPETKPRRKTHVAWRVLKTLASLRLTVVLFSLSLFLVFTGTLAQMDEGIWTIVDKYFRSFFVWIPFQTLIRFGQVFFFFPKDWKMPGAIPYPGGWTIGALLLVNLLAAHAVRFKVSWKRSGILMLHAGLIVMMAGEFIAKFAVEGNLTVGEGQSVNYIEELKPELAIVNHNDPDTEPDKDKHTVIPASRLKEGVTIQDESLPFDVQITRFMANSIPKDVEDGQDNPATVGAGLGMLAEERPVGKGVSNDSKTDIPSAYVTFKEKGTDKELGTYLLSVWLQMVNDIPEQKVTTADGKTYSVALRFKRAYKDYTVHLIKVSHDTYQGSDIAKNFSSQIRLVDPTRGEDREVLISMNDPLRYQGETFYQSQVRDGVSVTVLQVVRNPGWRLPYLSCVMVGVGMMIHFGINLLSFLRRRAVL
jgi:ResB-like family